MTGAPDLSAGHCQPGRSWLPPEAWITPHNIVRRASVILACRACPVLTLCHAWVLSIDEGVAGYADHSVVAGLTRSQRDEARATMARQDTAGVLAGSVTGAP